MFPHITVFEYSVSTYTVFWFVGTIFAVVLFMLLSRLTSTKMKQIDLIFIPLSVFSGGVFGAKLFQLIGYIINTGRFFHSFQDFYRALDGAGVLYGGIAGGCLALFSYVKICRLDLISISNPVVPAVLMAQGIGRVGCFARGCCFGKVSQRLGLVFKESSIAPNNVPLIPVQLFECFYDIILSVFFISLLHRDNKRFLLPYYFVFYSVGRFFLEFLRGDSTRGVYLLSVSQWISIAVFFMAILYLLKNDWNRLPVYRQ